MSRTTAGNGEKKVTEGGRRSEVLCRRQSRARLHASSPRRPSFCARMKALVEADSGRGTPFELGPFERRRQEPRLLSGGVSVVALFDLTRPEAKRRDRPPASRIRASEAEVRPRMRCLGMLENATPPLQRCERRREAAPVVTLDAPDFRGRTTGPVATPPLARRMRHHRPRPRVLPGIADFVPRVDVRKSEVRSLSRYEEGGNSHKEPHWDAKAAAMPW